MKTVGSKGEQEGREKQIEKKELVLNNNNKIAAK